MLSVAAGWSVYPTVDLQAAPFPGPDLVRLSTNLTGVSTWPGYRQASSILDIDVQSNRVALAGFNLGAIIIEHQPSGTRTVRRIVNPDTSGSTGSFVKLNGDTLFLLGGDGMVFDLSPAGTPVADFPNRSYNGHIGVDIAGDLAISWNHTDAYLLNVSNPFESFILATNRFPSATVNSIQLCEVAGQRLQVALIAPNSSAKAYLQTWGLAANAGLGTNKFTLPFDSSYAGEPKFILTRDGRIALKHKDPDKVMLLQINLSGSTINVTEAATLTTPPVGLTRLALAGDVLAVMVGYSASPELVNTIHLYDVSNLASPKKAGVLPLPFKGAEGNAGHMMISGGMLYYASQYGAYCEADISDLNQPRWVYETFLTGDTKQLSHNGSLVLVSESGAYGVRLTDLSDGATPTTLSHVILDDYVYDLAWNRHLAYAQVSGGSSGLQTIDFTQTRRTAVSTLPAGQWINSNKGIFSDENLVVFCDSSTGLEIFTLEIPGYPRKVSRLRSSDLGFNSANFSHAALKGHHLVAIFHALNGKGGFVIYDVRQPQSPSVLKIWELEHSGQAERLLWQENTLWLLRYDGGSLEAIYAYDLTDPANPSPIGSLTSGLSGGHSLIHGQTLMRPMNNTQTGSPWSGGFTAPYSLEQIALSEAGEQISLQPQAEVWLRRWYGEGRGRYINIGQPHVVGDLILLPLDNHGFDVVRADFLPRTAPVIKHQPRPFKVATGRRAVLSATVDGALPLTYQWFKGEQPLTNSARLSGANSLFLVIPEAEPADAGTYTLRVNNSEGEIFSVPTALEVVAARPLALQLASTGSNAWRAEVSSDPGLVVRVEWSDDLVTWNLEETTALTPDIALPDGSTSADLKVRSGKQRFYRARIVYPD